MPLITKFNATESVSWVLSPGTLSTQFTNRSTASQAAIPQLSNDTRNRNSGYPANGGGVLPEWYPRPRLAPVTKNSTSNTRPNIGTHRLEESFRTRQEELDNRLRTVHREMLELQALSAGSTLSADDGELRRCLL